jgi:hypothetical protein
MTTRSPNVQRQQSAARKKAKRKRAKKAVRTSPDGKGKQPETKPGTGKKAGSNGPSGQVRTPHAQGEFEVMPLWKLKPARMNDIIYKKVSPSDPQTKALAKRVKEEGLLEPIVLTLDDVILSGHRRRVACQLAGLTEVRVRRHPIRSTDDDFASLLVAFNEQRVKTVDEVIREAVVTSKKTARSAYDELIAYRQSQRNGVSDRADDANLCLLTPQFAARRSAISAAKRPMLRAVQAVIEAHRNYWPLTLRQIHYQLLNDPPLRNARDPDSRYANTRKCYSDLSDLLTRARLSHDVHWAAINDPTRPASRTYCKQSVRAFIDGELDGFLRHYSRDLLQSQEAYFEIIAEKQTVEGIVRRAAEPYTMPYMIGRGYSSIDARYQLAQRFYRSRKDKLVLLFLGDHDPEGENIPNTFAGSMRDEFGVHNITPLKVALTREQVDELKLPPVMTAKETSSRAAAFVAEHGEDVFELEAVSPDDLSQILTGAIEDVLDMELFEQEQQHEEQEALELDEARSRAMLALGNFRTSPDHSAATAIAEDDEDDDGGE